MLVDEIKRKNPQRIPWLIDLSLWIAWHSKRGSMPSMWSGLSQVEIANRLSATGWNLVKPWELIYEGVEIQVKETQDEKLIHLGVGGQSLTASWTLGPDGDWWQTDHLISSPGDFESAIKLASSISYRVDEAVFKDLQSAESAAVLAIELPKRSLSTLLHEYLGWGEGLLMMGDHEKEVDQLLQTLDSKLYKLTEKCADMPGSVLFCPDNLDGQFISPEMFSRYLAPNYIKTSSKAHAAGKSLGVHVGGSMRRLLKPLADTGVDLVEGVSGLPQSDVPIPEARNQAGTDLILWGGIPQDWLLETTPVEKFKDGVDQAIGHVLEDGRTILGVADRVPVAAQIDRLVMLGDIVQARMGV